MSHSPRIQVPTQISRPGFRPAASPVDTFRQTSAGSGLAQLARSLSGLAPELMRYAQVDASIRDEKALRAAEQQAAEDLETLQEAQKTYAAARAEGLIQEHQDPVYRARHQELVGRGLGERAMASWEMYKAENLAEATTLEEYDAGFNAFYDEWTESNLGASRDEPALATAYRQTVQSGLLQDRQTWSRQAGARLSALSDQEYRSGVSAMVFNLHREGATAQELGRALSDSLEAQIGLQGARGSRRTILNRNTVKAALDATVQFALTADTPGQALEILDALRAVPTSPGNSLADSPDVQDMIDQATSRILANARSRDQISHQAQLAQANDLVREARALVWEGGPSASLQPYRDQLNALGLDFQTSGMALNQLESVQEAMLLSPERSDPAVRRRILLNIYANPRDAAGNQRAVQAALANRGLNTGDAQNLYATAANLAAGYTDTRKYGTPVYASFETQFLAQFGDEDFMDDSAKAARLQALSDLNTQWLSWRDANPEADSAEQWEWLLKTNERMLKVYAPSLTTGVEFSRNPVLGARPEWHQARIPEMTATDFWFLDAVYGQGLPLEGFGEDRIESLIRLLELLEIGPEDVDQLGRLLEAQRPFFDSRPTPR